MSQTVVSVGQKHMTQSIFFSRKVWIQIILSMTTIALILEDILNRENLQDGSFIYAPDSVKHLNQARSSTVTKYSYIAWITYITLFTYSLFS